MENSYKLSDTDLCPWIKQECLKKKIIFATSNQQAIIPQIINGKDSIIFSRTGTGKTLSYILPLVHIHFLTHINCSLNIIVPTIELGLQIYQTYNSIGKSKNITAYLSNKNKKSIFSNNKSEICKISTLEFSVLNLKTFNNFTKFKRVILVFDEADLLIKTENFNTVRTIILNLRPTQINLFGVTETDVFKYIQKFLYQKKIFLFQEKLKKFQFFSDVKHEYIYCSPHLRSEFLVLLIRYKEKEKVWNKKNCSILIFLKGDKEANNLVRTLRKNKIIACNFHSRMDIRKKTISVQLIKKGIVDVIISTDSGSRGMNFPFINLIINADIPEQIETYLSRVGRIGRYAKKGSCLNLIDKNNARQIYLIGKNLGIRFDKLELYQKKKKCD